MPSRFRDKPDPREGYVTICGKWFDHYASGVRHERDCPRCRPELDNEPEPEDQDDERTQ